MKLVLKIGATVAAALAIFLLEIVVGNSYQFTDFLCLGEASPFLL